MEIKIKKQLKLILITVTLVIIIILPSLIYRAYIELSNPDAVIYAYKDSHFIPYCNIEDNELELVIIAPYKIDLGRVYYKNGLRPNYVDKAYVDIPDVVGNSSDITSENIDIDEVGKYGINPMLVDIEYGVDLYSCPILFTDSYGQQFVIYQKYNKVYLHVVEN